LIGSAPFRRQEEQRPSVRGAKRATEYWAVVLDSVQHLTALSNSNDRPTGQIFATDVTPVVRSLDPDSPVRIHADGVRAEAFRPDPAIGQGPSASMSKAVSRPAKGSEMISSGAAVHPDTFGVREEVAHLPRRGWPWLQDSDL
jgi:hypothetical protein